MSLHPENFNVPNPEIGTDSLLPYCPITTSLTLTCSLRVGVNECPSHSVQGQASYGVSNFADGSGHIFSMYLEMATEEDKKMVESWKADANGILIFVRLYSLIGCFMPTLWSQAGLFSVALATLISVSIRDIRQNPQDTSNFYLSNIYQTLADPNRSNTPTPPPPFPPPFSPPNYAVWVNALWFLSLAISLTCALLATLVHQWARRYLRVTQPRYSPNKRARIRSFFAEGVDRCLLPWTVEAMPTILHISLFLFFAGLVVFLHNFNLTIFKLALSWVGGCTALYGCITCMPIFRHDSPYHTPLSVLAWRIVTWTQFMVYRFLRWFNGSVRRRINASLHYQYREEIYRQSLVRGMRKTAEETALNSRSDMDARTFMWTFDCLDEDHELERFFFGLPGFRSSNDVDDPLPSLTEEEKSKLYEGLHGLLDHTFSSDLLPAPVKTRRALICAKAVDPEHTPNAFNILRTILSEYQHSGPVSTGIAKVLRGWGNTNMNEDDISYAQFAISKIIATMQPHDDSWYSLASDELGLPKAVLRDYAGHGASLKLAILIYLVRQHFSHFRKPSWRRYAPSSVLVTASNFDGTDTSPELQHEFCALWNQIVNVAQDGGDKAMAFFILGRIRNVLLALHKDTNSAPIQFSASTGDEDGILWEPSSYPVCKDPDHHAESTPLIYNDNASKASTTTTRAISHDQNVLAFVRSVVNPDPPSSSTHGPLPIDDALTDALLLDNQITIQGSLQPIGQTTTDSRRIPATSLSPVTACTTHRIVDHPSTPTADIPPRLPSPSPVTDAGIDGPSTRSPGTEHIEHRPLGPMHSPNDIV